MKKYILIPTLTALSLMAYADSSQSVTISGEVIDKEVTSLSFEGDNVVLSFTDGVTRTSDMSEVNIALTYTKITGIAHTEKESKIESGKVYNIAGQYMGSNTKSLSKGIYIINGKKLVVK